MTTMKTPGVYIVEKNAFPNAVVEVATAVPAFVGHTKKAANSGGCLLGKPWRISSMAEYIAYFGGAPQARFLIEDRTGADLPAAFTANGKDHALTQPVAITHEEQEDLNVTPQGKSINGIRSFAGEGVLVWGARTLDGNSLDWRYINVRRTMIMLEASIRLAAKAFVFEPNTANTWATIKGMIANFLTGIWKRGGLAGTVPDDAFSVHVGLGETTTPEDIAGGILRVTVLVAISRPAEFIELTFQQQMQRA